MKLKLIDLEQLKISKLNMRHGREAPDISDILPSIRESGLRQNLLVRKEGEIYGVIAGRRRYFALKSIAKETGKSLKVPCGIIEAGDNALAIEASLIENMARLPPTEMEQYGAFRKLFEKRRTRTEIANMFGITELKVKRILALAGLLPEIRKLYEEDKIQVPTIRALTLATKEQQTVWLKLYHNEDVYEPQGDRLKAWLSGGGQINTEVALFDIKTYNGVILTDLFDESRLFQDPELFWQHQNTAIAERVDTLKNQSWGEVILLERGERFYEWEHVSKSLEEGGKVFIETSHSGHVTVHEGYLSRADARRIDNILCGNSNGIQDNKPPRPEMSGPLLDYVMLHRHALAQVSLLERPALALRMVVAHMICSSALWKVGIHKVRSNKEATTNSVTKSKAHQKFIAERTRIIQVLGLEHETEHLCGHDVYGGPDLIEIFARLIGLPDDEIMKVLTIAMAESMAMKDGLVEVVGRVTEIDMPALWQPDEAFFNLLRDKRVINAMVAEVAGHDTAKSVLTDTGKAQKAIITNRLSGIGVDTPEKHWRPRWMQFPATSYLGDETCELSHLSTRVETVFEKPKSQNIEEVA